MLQVKTWVTDGASSEGWVAEEERVMQRSWPKVKGELGDVAKAPGPGAAHELRLYFWEGKR